MVNSQKSRRGLFFPRSDQSQFSDLIFPRISPGHCLQLGVSVVAKTGQAVSTDGGDDRVSGQTVWHSFAEVDLQTFSHNSTQTDWQSV